MTLRDDYVQALERENDDLRNRIRVLEEIAGTSLEVPFEYGLTRKEAIILGVMLKNDLARKEALMEALYPHDQDAGDVKILDVWVCHMRRKLKPWGIEIVTVYADGWRLPPASKHIVRSMLETCAA